MSEDIAADVEFPWKCELCGAMTRDNYEVADGWASAQCRACRACRGYVTCTVDEALATNMIQRGAYAEDASWHKHLALSHN